MSRFTIRYLGWVLVGASGSLSFVAGFSFGMFLLPVFLAALIWMLFSRRPEDLRPPQSPGVLLGFALTGTVIYALNPDWWQLIPVGLALTTLGIGLPLLLRPTNSQPSGGR